MAPVNWAMASSTLPSCISSLPRLQASSAFGASCPNAGQTRSPHNSTATRQLGCRQRRGCTFIACSCSSSPIRHDRRTLLGAACMPCREPLKWNAEIVAQDDFLIDPGGAPGAQLLKRLLSDEETLVAVGHLEHARANVHGLLMIRVAGGEAGKGLGEPR